MTEINGYFTEILELLQRIAKSGAQLTVKEFSTAPVIEQYAVDVPPRINHNVTTITLVINVGTANGERE